MGELSFENTSMYRELLQIVNSDSNPVHFNWFAKIHVGSKLNYNPIKVVSIDVSQDYESKYADEIIVTIAISGGMYAVDIYPYKDMLEITLSASPIGEVSNSNDSNKSIQTERYSATLIDTGNPVIEGNNRFTPTKDALDLTGTHEVSFQLVNKAVQQMRLISVGGIYRKVLAGDVIKTILTNETKKIKVDGARLPIGVDIVPGYNTNVREHILIPQGTKLVDVPEYIHSKCGGVYAAGFNYYMQGDYWYVYPTYDLSRVAKASSVLTVINVPPHKFPSIERTYRKNGKSVVILATGEVKFRDGSEVQQLNAGNGVRFADANNFIGGFGKTVNNKTTLSRGSNNSEVTAQTRANGINNVPLSSNAINANPYLEYSKLARNNGAILAFVWENSLPSLITPGAMVKIHYLNNDVINVIEGVILKCHHFTQMKNAGILNSRYVTRSMVSVFCNLVKTGS